MSEADPINVPRLAYGFARRYGVIALDRGGQAILATLKDAPLDAILEARRVVGRPVRREPMEAAEFEGLMAKIYAQGDLTETAETALGADMDLNTLADNLPRTSDLLDSDDDAPVIKLINGILQEAIKTRASDIHIEPYENRLAVRFRIDGALRDTLSLSPRLASVLVSRVKVMARLDIAKKRIPQDGRFSLNLGQRAVDVRVSTLPSQYGERLVMRLLEKSSSLMNLSDLGMEEDELDAFTKALKRPNGIILVTGPTGSGKTTTLYASLTKLNDGSRNILTVEDPVEYALDGIGQTQVNNQVGGHLVLSTVHTNSAVAAITRLRDMGIEPFLLASTVTAIVAQRLVRRLCPDCKEPYTPGNREVSDLGVKPTKDLRFFKSVGCAQCHQIGYVGRLGLYEVVVMDDVLRGMIHDGSREVDMSAHAFRNRNDLLRSGTAHVLSGLTSAEEVLRVCRAKADAEVEV